MGQKKKSGSSKLHGNVANTKVPEMQFAKCDDIINHYNILIEDVEAIDSEHVPLLNYPEVQSDANQNSRADEEWRRGASWTEMKHRWASCALLEDGNNHLNLCLQW
ncbi:hypothetical protein CQW23_30771 [Capsicum baccatum]|uniref:Uncharacterized protein n=1 Tax=Capsicum baccatum TaxID=33114 RepID=A0A2G2V9M0_CAPBA|nr:hypothetical protein CQW23_30771 [Capsicum baccatum]